jgi:hypothetical protein
LASEKKYYLKNGIFIKLSSRTWGLEVRNFPSTVGKNGKMLGYSLTIGWVSRISVDSLLLRHLRLDSGSSASNGQPRASVSFSSEEKNNDVFGLSKKKAWERSFSLF